MAHPKTIDYLIVGQGLAGSVFGLTALKEGKSIHLIDKDGYSRCSKVAGGLYNPIVFKRLTQSWRADELLPVQQEFYKYAEQLLGLKFIFDREIVKIFADNHQKDFWKKKSKESTLLKYFSNTNDAFPSAMVSNPFGVAAVKNAGYVDVKNFIETCSKFFIQQGVKEESLFDYAQLGTEEGLVKYKNIAARRVVFCEGHKAVLNPFFPEINMKLTKGEVLTISISSENGYKEVVGERCVNKGVFILPIGNNLYKVGATYNWNDLTENVTTNGLEELKQKLDKILKVPYDIVTHEAGVRPTVSDRRPILGTSKQSSLIAIFNGMGTKGVMLAPYFAKELFKHLEQGVPLENEVDIKRFRK